jgi:starch-binding outer membrane protein, SusD/RagB family
MKSRFAKFFIVVVFGGVLVSCSDDFLDRPSLSEISADNFYQTAGELKLATAALYGGSPWSDWNYTCYLPVGEVLSGNMAVGYWDDAVQLHTFSITSLNGIMISNWKSMYKIIAHCNVTIEAIKKSPASIADADKNAALAEARFIRGFAYYNLALLWGDVPIIEDNIKLTQSPLVFRNTVNDVYQFVVNDLTFASKNLPPVNEKGRLTTWSAKGLLGKVYLTWSGLNPETIGQRKQTYLDSAARYAGNVCKNSGLQLEANYADLFTAQKNDNPESLFALQWSPGVDWLQGNMLQIYSTLGDAMPINGSSGWFGIQPTVDLYGMYSEDDSVRRKATFMLRGDYYPELNAAAGGITYAGDASLKKHIIGTEKDNNAPTMGLVSSIEHNALLRLADVYLVYAEALLGNNSQTSNADALMYFNLVRTRAGLDPVTSIDADALFNERRVELACEGHFWNDLVSLSYYNPQKAIDFLNNRVDVRVPFEYSADGVVTPREPYGIISPANAGTFKFPVPSSEITANPKLLDAPVPYPFN